MDIEYKLADSNTFQDKDFENHKLDFFDFNSESFRVDDQICLDTLEGIFWYKVVGRIFVNNGCEGTKLIIQLKPI